MVEVNKLTTTATTHWRFVDRTAGVDNSAIDWRFSVGQRVKIRLINEMESDHPMHHPFHLHGAGRFLVLARDGVVESNLVWKDTVLIRTGQTVGHPVRRHQSRPLDGALPYPRTHAERHDVQLYGRPRLAG
jgi:FtsP/CotA-like multicopper oxidase with cupredoxin domain